MLGLYTPGCYTHTHADTNKVCSFSAKKINGSLQIACPHHQPTSPQAVRALSGIGSLINFISLCATGAATSLSAREDGVCGKL